MEQIERRASEKIAMLDERTMQITKTLDNMAGRFESSVDKLGAIVTKLSEDTGAQILAHTLKEEEVWREFSKQNDDSHRALSIEFENKLGPLDARVGALEKKIWQYGGGLLVLVFIVQNIDFILKLFGK